MELDDLRTSPSQQPQQSQQQPQQQTSQQQSSTQQQQSSTTPPVQQPTPPQQTSSAKAPSSSNNNETAEQHRANDDDHDAIQPAQSSTPTAKLIPPVQRTISLPAPQPSERYRTEPRINYSQSERIRERPRFARSTSRREVIKNFIRRETANFFGVDEENEVEQQQRWLDRRKRLASRKYGPLKDDYQIQNEDGLRRTMSDVGSAPPQLSGQLLAGRPDVLPGLGDVPDSSGERLPGTTTIRRKDSVARMTWDGLAYVVTKLFRINSRSKSQSKK